MVTMIACDNCGKSAVLNYDNVDITKSFAITRKLKGKMVTFYIEAWPDEKNFCQVCWKKVLGVE